MRQRQIQNSSGLERWHELCYEQITWLDMLCKVYNEATDGFDNFVGYVNKSANQALQEKHLLFTNGKNNPNLRSRNPGYLGI